MGLVVDYMFDHTVIIANDDPAIRLFEELADNNIIQLRNVEATGAEKFAEFIYNKINTFVVKETNGRVKVSSVEVMENKKNTAIYSE